jgi:hypothetical protein
VRALPVAALALLGPLADTGARWAPAVGEEVEWRWSVGTELEIEDARLQCFDGEWQDIDELVEAATFEVRDQIELVVRDRIEARIELRPDRCVRRSPTHRTPAGARQPTHAVGTELVCG